MATDAEILLSIPGSSGTFLRLAEHARPLVYACSVSEIRMALDTMGLPSSPDDDTAMLCALSSLQRIARDLVLAGIESIREGSHK